MACAVARDVGNSGFQLQRVAARRGPVAWPVAAGRRSLSTCRIDADAVEGPIRRTLEQALEISSETARPCRWASSPCQGGSFRAFGDPVTMAFPLDKFTFPLGTVSVVAVASAAESQSLLASSAFGSAATIRSGRLHDDAGRRRDLLRMAADAGERLAPRGAL
jgi:hypothetical protein